MVTIVAVVLFAVPALAFTLWPLVRPGSRGGLLPLPPDPRQQLLEEKRGAYGALRELAFEHDAGHLSDDDYAALRARYEANAARILQALDDLGPVPAVTPPATSHAADAAPQAAATPVARPLPWTRRPLTIAAGSALLVVFGIALGLGAARYSELDRTADLPMPGSRPLAPSLLDRPAAPSDRPGVPSLDRPENRSGDPRGDRPGGPSGDRPGDRRENTSGNRPGDPPGDRTGDRPGGAPTGG
jgi:hypothetical protein